jgi:hypothetical protein
MLDVHMEAILIVCHNNFFDVTKVGGYNFNNKKVD